MSEFSDPVFTPSTVGSRYPTLMGILNVTPDSFSDGGLYVEPDAALSQARKMVAEGADIIDVGGESTRPGADPVSIDEELRRVVPVVEALADEIEVAVDTRNEVVARAAVAAGAKIINDVSASLWRVAAETGSGWIAMHMLGNPQMMQADPQYDDVTGEVVGFLTERASEAAKVGVERIWIDPGFGFGKTMEHNLQLMTRIGELVATGWPVAVGTSRKSMLGKLLAASDRVDSPVGVDDRLEGSIATAAYALLQGVDLVRAHDIKAIRQTITVICGPDIGSS